MQVHLPDSWLIQTFQGRRGVSSSCSRMWVTILHYLYENYSLLGRWEYWRSECLHSYAVGEQCLKMRTLDSRPLLITITSWCAIPSEPISIYPELSVWNTIISWLEMAGNRGTQVSKFWCWCRVLEWLMVGHTGGSVRIWAINVKVE